MNLLYRLKHPEEIPVEKYEYSESDYKDYEVHTKRLLDKFIKECDEKEKERLELTNENSKLKNKIIENEKEIKKLEEQIDKFEKLKLLNEYE